MSADPLRELLERLDRLLTESRRERVLGDSRADLALTRAESFRIAMNSGHAAVIDAVPEPRGEEST